LATVFIVQMGLAFVCLVHGCYVIQKRQTVGRIVWFREKGIVIRLEKTTIAKKVFRYPCAHHPDTNKQNLSVDSYLEK
jgi:hypothetical protein